MNKYFLAVVQDNNGQYRSVYFQGHSAYEAAQSFLDTMGLSDVGLDDALLGGESDLYDFVSVVCDEQYFKLLKMYGGPRPVSEIQ